jgi:hypothetical protein
MARASVRAMEELARPGICVLCLVGIFSTSLRGQVQIPSPARGGPAIPNSDLAALEEEEVRKDFRCRVTPIEPFQGFDLRLHSGYEIKMPARELEGQSGVLRCLFRVIPEGHPDEPVYFSQRLQMHQTATSGGAVRVEYGGFDLGPGKYRVDFFLRDARERICSLHWDVHAKAGREEQDGFGLAPGVVQASPGDLFDPEPPVTGRQAGGLHAMVMVNLAPQNDAQTVLEDTDLERVLSILRCIAREPRFATFSLTAFQLNDMRVIFRQRDAAQIDFPGLGDALTSPQVGTVDVRRLEEKHSRTAFLKDLVAKTIRSAGKPDILLLLSPKAMLNGHILPGDAGLAPPGYPVVYLSYNSDPQGNPWQDTISEAVKALRGRTYTIDFPSDLEAAWRSLLQIAGGQSGGDAVAVSFRGDR